jgi:quinolinate synthase
LLKDNVGEYITVRKKELNALIMAHYYQPAEIQDIADFVGDSLQLARQAAESAASVIVCCGVKFMAESAKILSPDKTVILPNSEAGCPMADMATAGELRRKKEEHPEALVVSYVNTSAEVKAESYICCTSSNALDVVASIPADKPIIFVPDRNLGSYIQGQTGRDMILWDGYCPIHDRLSIDDINRARSLYPGALITVHPECRPEITRIADAVRSTAGLLAYIQESPAREFILGTEAGFVHTLNKHCPDKKIYLAYEQFNCPDMKLINLERLAQALENLETRIEVDSVTSSKAREALDRMLQIC